MKTVAIISQKGGAGKTTLALHLATSSALAGRNTAIIDLDPQASAANWGDRRTAELPVVLSAHASRLGHEIRRVGEMKGDLLIIDTAPHSDSAASGSRQGGRPDPGPLPSRHSRHRGDQHHARPGEDDRDADLRRDERRGAPGERGRRGGRCHRRPRRAGLSSSAAPAGRVLTCAHQRPVGRRVRTRRQGGGGSCTVARVHV